MVTVKRTQELVKILRTHALNEIIPRNNKDLIELDKCLTGIGSRYAKAFSNKNKYDIIPKLVDIKNSKGTVDKVRMLCIVNKVNPQNQIPIAVTKVSPNTKKLTNKYKIINKIFRDLVRDHVEEYRKNWRRKIASAKRRKSWSELAALKTCALSGKDLSSEESHVDHIIPFSNLLEDFLLEQGINDRLQLGVEGRGNVRTLKNKDLAEKWINFHEKKAKYQMVLASENKKRGKQNNEEYILKNFKHE